jgi:hypothetical protein
MTQMTQDTQIILHELAIVQTMLRVVMEQQEPAIAAQLRQLLQNDPARFPEACTEQQLAQTKASMRQRLQEQGIQSDFLLAARTARQAAS